MKLMHGSEGVIWYCDTSFQSHEKFNATLETMLENIRVPGPIVLFCDVVLDKAYSIDSISEDVLSMLIGTWHYHYIVS